MFTGDGYLDIFELCCKRRKEKNAKQGHPGERSLARKREECLQVLESCLTGN